MSYGKLFVKSLVTQTFYVGEFFITNATLLVQAVVVLMVGLYFNSISQIYAFNDVLLYYLIGIGFVNIFQRTNVVRELEDEIKMGNFIVHLTKPYAFMFFYQFRDFSKRLLKGFQQIVVYGIIVWVLYGFVTITIEQFLRAMFMVPLMILFMYMTYAIFSYLAFYFERIHDLSRIYFMIGFFIGGGLVSIKYFPDFIAYFPQSFVFGNPLHYIITGEFSLWYLFIMYLLLYTLIIAILHKKIIQRLETNGG